MTNLWKVVIAVVVTLVIVGGGTYYYMNGKAVSEKNDLQARIDDLSAKVDESATASDVATTGAAVTTGTATPSSTAGWKTYTNSTYGYSIKYPSSYIQTNGNYPGSTNAFFYAPQDDRSGIASLTITSSSIDNSLDYYVDQRVSRELYSNATKITFAGEKAYEGVDNGLVNRYTICFVKGTTLYEIGLNSGNKDDLISSKAALTSDGKLMLSTFTLN